MSEVDIHNPLSMTTGFPRHERPIWIWDLDSRRFLWANGEGIKFWSQHSLDDLQTLKIRPDHPALLAVQALLPFDERGAAKDAKLQFSTEEGPRYFNALCRPYQTDHHHSVIVELKGMNLDAARQQETALRASAKGEAVKAADEVVKAVPPLQTLKIVKGADLSPTDEEIAEPDNSYGKNAIPLSLGEAAIGEEGKPAVLNPVLSERTEDRLHELARLIRAAGKQRQLNEEIADSAATKPLATAPLDRQAETSVSPPHDPPLAPQIINEKYTDEVSQPTAIAGQSVFSQSGAEEELLARYWAESPVDITALAGVAESDELQEILDQSPKPLALFSFQKLIAANEAFLSEFGYGEFKSLSIDGVDWILPHARLALRAFFEQAAPQPLLLKEVRIRSGRKFNRPVFIRPLKFVRFDRVLGLMGLDEWHGEDHVETHTKKHTPHLKERPHAELPLKVNHGVSEEPQSPSPQPVEATIDDVSSIPLLSAISHEVRTPLNVIIGFSEIMAREEFGPLGQAGAKGASKYAGYVKDIQSSAQHALSLINDLLDLTKLRAGKWELEPEATDINEIVREQTRLMRGMAGQQKIRLRTDLEENLPTLSLDRRAMRQILFNLLSNSIKFSPAGGLVRVATERFSDEFVALTVMDEGCGMTEREVKQALLPFQQIAATDLKRGTGLGLPIAKALAEANDMQFAIESEKGVGTHAFMLIKI